MQPATSTTSSTRCRGISRSRHRQGAPTSRQPRAPSTRLPLRGETGLVMFEEPSGGRQDEEIVAAGPHQIGGGIRSRPPEPRSAGCPHRPRGGQQTPVSPARRHTGEPASQVANPRTPVPSPAARSTASRCRRGRRPRRHRGSARPGPGRSFRRHSRRLLAARAGIRSKPPWYSAQETSPPRHRPVCPLPVAARAGRGGERARRYGRRRSSRERVSDVMMGPDAVLSRSADDTAAVGPFMMAATSRARLSGAPSSRCRARGGMAAHRALLLVVSEPTFSECSVDRPLFPRSWTMRRTRSVHVALGQSQPRPADCVSETRTEFCRVYGSTSSSTSAMASLVLESWESARAGTLAREPVTDREQPSPTAWRSGRPPPRVPARLRKVMHQAGRKMRCHCARFRPMIFLSRRNETIARIDGATV